MSLQAVPFPALPESTARVARRAFRRGNLYLTIGDQIGALWNDADWQALYALQGAPGFSPAQLLLVLIFQALENLSDRQAAESVRGRIDWKYALHLSLDNDGFDFSVLSAFRDRLIANQVGLQVLDRVLERLRGLGLLKEGRQRTDATYVLQAPRMLNRLEMVMETMRMVLEDLAAHFPLWLAPIAQGHWVMRYLRGWHALRLPRGQEARQQLAEEVGQDGWYLLEQVRAENTPSEIRERPSVQRLAKVWAQQYEPESGHWRPPGTLPEGKELIQTPHDPESRYGEQRGHGWQGYKLHVTETTDPEAPRLITQVTVTEAATADVSAVEPIQQSLVARGFKPREHLGDRGYLAAHTIKESRERGIDLIGPVLGNTTWQGRQQGVRPEQFAIDWQGKQARCPEGHASQLWSESHNSYGRPVVHIRFSPAACGVCARRECCTHSSRGRSVAMSPDFPILQEARTRQQTEAFKHVYAQRSGIEGTLSHAVREHGARQCRYIGLWKTQLQEMLVATAIDLERAARWLMGERPAPTRASHLSNLTIPTAA